jgi:CysZ protein
MTKALAAIGGALKDVLGGRLGWLALLCLVVAIAATIAAAWAALRFLLPLIPEGEGWLGYLWTAAEWLSGAGLVILSILLAPAVSMIVGGALFDVAAERVEKAIGAPAGRMVPLQEGLANGLRIGLPALFFNIIAIPLYFIPVVNLVVFFWLNGYLMGREYSALAAVRRMNWHEARALRRRAPLSVFLVGLACSFIPFIAPLVGASAMTRLIAALPNTSSGKAS